MGKANVEVQTMEGSMDKEEALAMVKEHGSIRKAAEKCNVSRHQIQTSWFVHPSQARGV